MATFLPFSFPLKRNTPALFFPSVEPSSGHNPPRVILLTEGRGGQVQRLIKVRAAGSHGEKREEERFLRGEKRRRNEKRRREEYDKEEENEDGDED